MNEDEIYQKLKSGESPRFIKGIEEFDDSELVQWMVSYHEGIKAELLKALKVAIEYLREDDGSNQIIEDYQICRRAISKALGQ